VNTAKVKVVSTVEGKRETAVKPSTSCNWRPHRYNWHNVSKYNGGSSLRNCYIFKDPLGRHAVSTVGGKRETAVKSSAGCNWRPQRYYITGTKSPNGFVSL
ncbi:hypothetical protein Tco_0137340, partial [Tanacetum coccineum]